jgi:hypothetical protein
MVVAAVVMAAVTAGAPVMEAATRQQRFVGVGQIVGLIFAAADSNQ